MNAANALAMSAAVVVTFPMVVALLRWPGRTVGFGLALLAFSLAGLLPAAAVIGLTAAGAYARHLCEHSRWATARRLLPFPSAWTAAPCC